MSSPKNGAAPRSFPGDRLFAWAGLRNDRWPRWRCGSLLVQFLAFDADPVALVVTIGAERGGHHGHAAAWTDRRAVVVIHAVSISLPE